MNKNSFIRLLLLLLICHTSIYATAKHVDTLYAQKAATHFLLGKSDDFTRGYNRQASPAKLVYTGTVWNEHSRQRQECLYIFNVGGGFVIVSADDRIEPIIGYSTEGPFDPQNIPSNLQDMLDLYAAEIQQYTNQADNLPNEATAKWQQLISDSYRKPACKGVVVGPLLSSTWDQNSPYNLYCPVDTGGPGGHAYGGCVATAMAQTMRYWEYPSKGVGSKSYVCNFSNEGYGDYGTLSANFEVGSYNYSLMPLYISSSTPSNQISAIARLIYHCGVSIEMKYGMDGSGGSIVTAANSLAQYFKYSTNYGTLTPQYKSKNSYSSSAWESLIKSELDAWRPVIYNGVGTGAHAFVCDGYDDQGYFHFNWGWSGSHNGYYLLTALTPGYYIFTNYQAAIINIQGNTPLIKCNSESLSFISATNSVSESYGLSIHGIALSGDITISAPAHFEISTDSINYQSSLTVSGSGTTKIYVRYVPAATNLTTDQGTLTLTSDSVTKTVSLSGMTYLLECNPPQNVQYTTDNIGNIQLSWDAPVQDIHTYKFSIDSTINPETRYGFNGVSSYLLAQRACESDLMAYHQKQLTQVSFYLAPSIYNRTSAHTIKVFQGGSYINGAFNEGTLVREQSVSQISAGWNTVTLSQPLVIDAGQELWYGVQFNTSTKSVISIGTDPGIGGKGDLVNIYSTWYSLGSFGINFNIPFKITIQDSPSSIENYTITQNNNTVGSTTSTQFQDHVSNSGSYLYHVTANWDNGCSSSSDDIPIHIVTDCPTLTGDTVANACNSFNWYEHTNITSSGNYTHTFQNSSGCDSTVTLHLTIHHPTYGDTTAVACESFTWHGQTYTQTPTTAPQFTIIGGNKNGCDSIVTLHLTVIHKTYGDTTAVACEAFTWHGQTYTETPTTAPQYTIVGGNQNGCDSIVTLHLTINHKTYGDTTAVACESFTWHGQTYTETPTTAPQYTIVGGNQNGCDSTVTLHLTINHKTYGDTTAVACESFTWHGQTYTLTPTTAPQYTIIGGNKNGCDSIVTLHLVINHALNTDTVAEAVEAFVWHREGDSDTTITLSGIYTHSHPDDNGCDQTDTLHLTVYHATGSQIDTSACEVFIWQRPLAGDTTLLHSGIYRDTLSDMHGADSVATLVLTVKHGSHFPFSVAECDSYTWHDTTRTESGTYIFEYLNNDGCPSSDTLHLVINHALNTDTVAEAVEAFVWHREGGSDTTITLSGTYTHSHPDDNGCDQTDTLHLTVYHATGSQIDTSACEEFIWQRPLAGDTTITNSGTYVDNLTDVHGADSVITLVLTINPSYYIPENVTVMQAQLPYIWHGQTFNESTTAFDSLSTLAGCDSVFYLNLTVVPYNIIQDNPIALCQGETQLWRGQLLSEQGIYSDTVLGENTIYTVVVTVNPTYYFPENVTVMEAQLPYLWHGQTFNESATAFDSLSTQAGCDSVFYLNLTVTSFTIIQDNPIALCQGETQLWRGQLLSEQGTYNDTVPAENTIYIVEVSVNPTYYFPENVTVMEAQMPYLWHGQTFNESATAFDSLSTAAGCDSVFYLNLTVVPFNIVQDNPIALCQGETQLWRGHLLFELGIYSDTVPAENTIYTVVVTVRPTYNIQENMSVCESALPFTWHNQTVTGPGIYTDSSQTTFSCDSIHTLSVYVTNVTTQEDSMTVCGEDATYTWHNMTLSETGIYSDTLRNTNGCDSIIYTMNFVKGSPFFSEDSVYLSVVTLPYVWHGMAISDAGVYYDSLQTSVGCDSVYSLQAYYYDLLIVDTPITLCPGDTVFWRMRTITESGTYRDTVFRWGDRFIFSVVVTMGEPFYHNDTVTVCQDELPYIWHEQSFDTSGTSILRLQTVAGCDSIYMLTLTVNPSIRQNDTAETCQGTPYAWRGLQLETSGYYVDSVENTSGCEDVYTLLLTVNPTYAVDTTVTITTNDLPYHFVSGQIDTTFSSLNSQFSTFNFQFSTEYGCDSIVTLSITLNVGIENHTTDFIRAFPNPTTGHLTVIGSEEISQLQLFDAYGRRVGIYPVEGRQTEIDLHGLASGVYFLKAMRHNQPAGTLKIIKNKE